MVKGNQTNRIRSFRLSSTAECKSILMHSPLLRRQKGGYWWQMSSQSFLLPTFINMLIRVYRIVDLSSRLNEKLAQLELARGVQQEYASWLLFLDDDLPSLLAHRITHLKVLIQTKDTKIEALKSIISDREGRYVPRSWLFALRSDHLLTSLCKARETISEYDARSRASDTTIAFKDQKLKDLEDR